MKILVISYSQSGQLSSILKNFISPVGGDIDYVTIQTKPTFDFPWTSDRFFNAMPETVLEIPCALDPIVFKHEKYDLIILGYQPWFLSPSLPTTALLREEAFLSRVKDTKVVTVIGARNMWLNSQERIKQQISHAGGELVGNVPFIDRNNNIISAFTILHWMLTGRKDRKYGFFPKPGVSDKDIEEASVFGELLLQSIQVNDYSDYQKKVLLTNRVNIGTDILFIEGRAKKLFNIWANLIVRKGTTESKRKLWVNLYKYYLIIALFVVAPIVLTFYSVLIRPFTQASIKRKKEYFCSVNLRNK
ncbi:MAG: hypothetical protein WC044_12960 [Crocinitomicaceae bacterium]